MRNRIVRALAAGLLMLAVAGPAWAGAAEKRELIVELLDTTRMLDTIDRIRDQLLTQAEAAIKAADPAVNQRALEIVKDVVTEEYAVLTQETLAWSADFMFRHYTEEEVRQLIAFYRTEVGQKAIGLMPRMSLEMSTLLQRQIAELPARIQAKIDERVHARGEKL